MVLSKQLKTLLTLHRTTVSQLALSTGISSKTIYHYLEGRSPRNLLHILKICDHFKVSSDYLLFGRGQSPEKDLNATRNMIQAGQFEVFLRPLNATKSKRQDP